MGAFTQLFVQSIRPFTTPNPKFHPLSIPKTSRISLRPNIERLTNLTRPHQNHPSKLRCSSSSSSDHNPPFKTLTFPLPDLPKLTPLDVCKYALAFSLSLALARRLSDLLWNPFFWTYFSWTWVFWPWTLAAALAGYGLHCLRKHSSRSAGVFEQLAIVTAAFTWLTLVPPAHFNGFLEGWPFVFFFVYHYFFFFNVSVRRRFYGDLYLQQHDPKWDVSLDRRSRVGFCVGVLAGHWLAAFEGPELHTFTGVWANSGIWVLIAVALFMQYHSTLYFVKYSEKVAVPTEVVQFGPYRWVRHPIYASVMLLLVTYCLALRAPFSALFMVGVCLVYYAQKAKVEEALMVEEFGEGYEDYARKVRYRLIPLLY
ncbi:hypothetical protein QJS04_geneDACA011302 [Acorus gramineus]|uniref:Protein-S-isoprenylcysteine O-methyltransferase n=1 Tax=Acorus gramineus TaxID=55184 RepID=A0AAV9AJX7_ACOGR|nr:hypothetical protein QJS04_geneDACA011302 [Acorus gramineus]